MIKEARDFLTKPNRDFDDVCNLAGLDPEAVRHRSIRLIAKAPPAETLAVAPINTRSPRKQKEFKDHDATAL